MAGLAQRLEDGFERGSQRVRPSVYQAPEWPRWQKALGGQEMGWKGGWVFSCLQTGPPSALLKPPC